MHIRLIFVDFCPLLRRIATVKPPYHLNVAETLQPLQRAQIFAIDPQARLTMEDPKVLILDEPFNGLDRQGIVEIHALLQELKARGTTILLASHSAADITQACDVVFEFTHGKLHIKKTAE